MLFAVALILLPALSGATTAAASAPHVKQFNIVNVRSGKFLRVLRHNDVLEFPFPHAVVAIARALNVYHLYRAGDL